LKIPGAELFREAGRDRQRVPMAKPRAHKGAQANVQGDRGGPSRGLRQAADHHRGLFALFPLFVFLLSLLGLFGAPELVNSC